MNDFREHSSKNREFRNDLTDIVDVLRRAMRYGMK